MLRVAEILRKTNETDIKAAICLDGKGDNHISTGNGFFDHMLNLFASHGRFDLTVDCCGDLEVDFHHSAEDIGICLGKIFREALGEMRGIKRYGNIILPMDEALIMCAADISGRSHLSFNASIPTERVGDFECQLVEEFLIAFVRNAGITLHITQMAGTNSHHIIEGMFKALGRTLRQCVALDPDLANEIPSTKGLL